MAKQRRNRTEALSGVDDANPGRAHTRSRRRAAIAGSAALAVGALAVSAEAVAGDNSSASPKHRSTKGYLIPEAWSALIPAGGPNTDLEAGVLIPEAYGALTPFLLPGAPDISPEFRRALGLGS